MDLLKTRRELDSGKSIFDLSLRVVFYARVSTDRDEQLNSLANQINYYEEYIRDRKNWQFAGGYVDEGISGATVGKREDFLRMIKDAESRRFDLIITKEISRFSRNTLDSIKYTRQLLDCGVGVYFQSDNINTLYSDAELRLTIMASIAQDEVRRLSDRVKFGMKRAYEAGRDLGSKSIYGYDKKDGKLFINEKEAEFVRALFTIYAQGKYGYRSIARILGEMGFVNQKGQPLNPGTFRAIIENPKYKGYYRGRITESNNYRQKKSIKLPDVDRVMYKDPAIPAIVSEELWNRANWLLAEKREKYRNKSPKTQSRYKYSGKILCQEHNSFHYRKLWKDRKKPVEGWCCKVYLAEGRKSCSTPHIFTWELDCLMCFIARNIIKNPLTIVERLISRYKEGCEEKSVSQKEINKLLRESEKIEEKKEKLLELSIEESISKEDFLLMNKRLSARLELVREEIKRAESSRALKPYSSDNIRLFLIKNASAEETLACAGRAILKQALVLHGSTGDYAKLILHMKHGAEIAADIVRTGQSGNKRAVILYSDTDISLYKMKQFLLYINKSIEFFKQRAPYPHMGLG